jgi:hypothetical protein
MPVQNESRQRLLDARSSGHDGGVLGTACVPPPGTDKYLSPPPQPPPYSSPFPLARGAVRRRLDGGAGTAAFWDRPAACRLDARGFHPPAKVGAEHQTVRLRDRGPHGKLSGRSGQVPQEAGRLGAAKRRRLPASPVWMRVKNRRGGRSGERPKLRTTRPVLARAPATPSPHPEVLGEAEPRRTAEGETEMHTPRRGRPTRGKEKPCRKR